MNRKAKYKPDYNKSHLYKFYLNKYKEEHLIKQQPRYNKLIKEVNKKIINYLYQGFEVALPYKLGVLRINKIEPIYVFNEDGTLNVKKSSTRVDWGTTNKLWKEKPELANKTYIYHENYKTNGYYFKIAWLRPANNLKGLLKYYKFVPSRTLRLNFKTYTDSPEFNLHNYFTYTNKHYDSN